MESNGNRISRWDRVMMAIAFAEAGEHETAREFLADNQRGNRPDLRKRNAEQRPEIRA